MLIASHVVLGGCEGLDELGSDHFVSFGEPVLTGAGVQVPIVLSRFQGAGSGLVGFQGSTQAKN